MFRFPNPLPHHLSIMFTSTQSWINRQLSNGSEEDRQQAYLVFRSDYDREWSQCRVLRLYVHPPLSLSICSLIARECSNSRGSSFEKYQCSSNDRLDLDHVLSISPLALLPILFISLLKLRFLSSRYRFSPTFIRSRKCVQQCSKSKHASTNPVSNELPRVARPSRRLLASTKPSRNDRETFAQKDSLVNHHSHVLLSRKEALLPFFIIDVFNLSSFLRTHHNPHHSRPITPSFRDPSLLLRTPTFTPLIILHQTSLSPLEPLNHFPSPSSSSSQPSSSSEPNSFPIFSSNHDSRNRTFNSPNFLRIIL